MKTKYVTFSNVSVIFWNIVAEIIIAIVIVIIIIIVVVVAVVVVVIIGSLFLVLVFEDLIHNSDVMK